MTLNRSTSPERPAEPESKASIFGALLMLGIGGIVIASGLLLIVVSVVLGDTALELP
jgi:hypothetical protein